VSAEVSAKTAFAPLHKHSSELEVARLVLANGESQVFQVFRLLIEMSIQSVQTEVSPALLKTLPPVSNAT
jgi:hypothetical protein